MKPFSLKTRLQWGWFKAAMIGTAIGLLIAPTVRNRLESPERQITLSDLAARFYPGTRIKVKLNGQTVALAKSAAEAEAAYQAARLQYNQDGIRILRVELSCEPADRETDAELLKQLPVLTQEELANALLTHFSDYADRNRQPAYTLRVNEYTVTLASMEDLVSVLEETQEKYDPADTFQVTLKPPASENVTMYEVAVAKKEPSSETGPDASAETDPDQTDNADTASSDQTDNADTGKTDSSDGSDEEDTEQTDNANAEDTDRTNQAQDTPADISSLPQAAGDGVQFVGFSDVIQVMGTYASKSEIKDRDTAYTALTTPQQEESIYVIQPGDYLELIAEKTHHTVEEIKELNPGIESDEDLYYDDRLHITVPQAAVQILVEKQETYRESYEEDVVYEDDENMFIGETEVVQEGKPGTHIVTDLVTYKDEQETGREQLEETVEVAAIAEIVKRGTKSQPTYMYPVTNWNITSNFGYRWGRLHAGVDVGIPIGTTVRASRAGQVVNAGWIGGYGNCVIIDHGDGVSTRYGHLSEITVSVGDYVDQGQQVALSGNTGRSTGPHLHFEIRIGGEATDPMPYLEGTAN